MQHLSQQVTDQLFRIEELLLEIKTCVAPPSPPIAQQIGGLELAAHLTGLSKTTLTALAAEGRIPHLKRGKKLYFCRRELLAWIEQDSLN